MAIVFDLDGTIVDARQSVLGTMRRVFLELGLAPTFEDRDVLGPPLSSFFRDHFPNVDNCQRAARRFRTIYDTEGILQVTLYPGMHDLLDWLQEQGQSLAVVSNNQDHVVRRILAMHDLQRNFLFVAGTQDALRSAVSKSELVSNALSKIGPDALLVGDTEADVVVATDCNLPAIFVSYGYRSEGELRAAGAQRIVGSVAELRTAIQVGWLVA